MINYRGVEYPDVYDVINFYSVPGEFGGFSKNERECKNLLIKLPSGVLLSIDNVNKNDLFNKLKNNVLPEEVRQSVQKEIDNVCTHYIDAALSGDISM